MKGSSMASKGEEDANSEDLDHYRYLLAEFFSELNEANRLLPRLLSTPEQRNQYYEFQDLLSKLGDSNPKISELASLLGIAQSLIFGAERKLLVDHGISTLEYEAIEGAGLRAGQLLSSMRALRIIQSMTEVEQEARRSAGSIGAVTLQGDFGVAYRMEWRSAFWLRILTFLLLAVAAGLAIWIAHEARQLDWKSEAARLAISIPFLAGAYFSSFEARDHRRYARNERGWQARIDSLEAFCSPLPDEVRNEIRAGFAKILYASPPDFGASSTLADSSQQAISQALSILRVVGGTSDKQSSTGSDSK